MVTAGGAAQSASNLVGGFMNSLGNVFQGRIGGSGGASTQQQAQNQPQAQNQKQVQNRPQVQNQPQVQQQMNIQV